MALRPSSIDVFLSDHLAARPVAEAWAADIGITTDVMVDRLRGIGCLASRSAVARWRRRFRQVGHGQVSRLRRQVVSLVMDATDDQLRRIMDLMGDEISH